MKVRGAIVAWLTDKVWPCDEKILGERRGGHRGQTRDEALAELVAVRTWAPKLVERKGALALKTDSKQRWERWGS